MSTAANGPVDRSDRQAKIQAAAPKESKLKPILAIIIGLLALAAIAAAVWFGARKDDTAATAGRPAGAVSDTGGIMLNAKDPGAGVPTLDIYEDYQCPYCGYFHDSLGKTVDELAASGKAKVVVHLKTFLDDGIPGEKSLTAANASACASDISPQAFAKVHDGIFAARPEKEGDPWPDMTFSDVATKAGITGEQKKTFDSCVKNTTYRSYLGKVEDQSTKDGVNGTPTYRLNGNDIDLEPYVDPATKLPAPEAPALLRKAVEDASKK
ncbi:DsbA family protein [Mobilicoccus pelagius]|uniref:Thioredoxin-like fold domain-containing protein n=1 Tax=Mobilicoccus pelagius NBRC 104925 TaxID=1089455 RepID=H5UQ75_9MICO|nr:thioredoxin domain-containing protein [Mobilicoccus pelagius]GAB47880.1 hypothetical protein MOPEL_029_01630 [Mobilicoccus pelagius NBRC 104925]